MTNQPTTQGADNMNKTPILTLTLTEADIHGIVDGANGGNAIGEIPMNEEIAVAIVAALRPEIHDAIHRYAATLIASLADRHSRVDHTLPDA
jgi:hypothetical protein